MKLLVNVVVAAALLSPAGCKKKTAARGPAPSWQVTVDKDAFEAVGVKGGTFVTVVGAGLTAYRDGKEAWKRPLDAPAVLELLVLPDGNILAGDDDGGVYAIAPADGAVAWKTRTPADEETHPSLVFAARSGARVVLLDSHNRLLTLEGRTLATSGALKQELSAEELALLPDGTRVVTTLSHVVLYGAAGERIGAFKADDVVSGIAVTDDAVIVSHDQGVARIRPAKCAMDADERVALGTRADGIAPPLGCLEKIPDEDNDGYRPAVTAAGVAYLADSDLRGRGKKKWEAGIHAVGHPIGDRDLAYVACWQEPDGDEIFVTIADLCAVSGANGDVKWRSRLGLRRAGLLDTPMLVDGDDHIFVWLGEQVAAVRKPGA